MLLRWTATQFQLKMEQPRVDSLLKSPMHYLTKLQDSPTNQEHFRGRTNEQPDYTVREHADDN